MPLTRITLVGFTMAMAGSLLRFTLAASAPVAMGLKTITDILQGEDIRNTPLAPHEAPLLDDAPMPASMPQTLSVNQENGVSVFNTVMPKKRTSEGVYYWPSPAGRSGSYSNSKFDGPNVSTGLAWTWHHPSGRFHTITVGTLIDNDANIYLTADDAVRKFQPDGTLLWTYYPRGEIQTSPSLMKGALFGDTSAGFLFSLNMATGEENWAVKVSNMSNGGRGAVGAHEGFIVSAVDACRTDFCKKYAWRGNSRVIVVNSTDGTLLQEYMPDHAVWNFVPLFPGDKTFLFQDVTGKVYCNSLKIGYTKWARGGHPGSFSAGGAILANDAVFSVSQLGDTGPMTASQIQALSLKDGAELWSARMQGPPHSIPAVGKLGRKGQERLTVLMGTGQACAPSPTFLFGFDAKTGHQTFFMHGEDGGKQYCAADNLGFRLRKLLGIRNICAPLAWSSPTITPDGTIYIGNQFGKLMQINDLNGDGHINTATELSVFEAGAAFTDQGGSFAPGMMAIASCDTLFVFNSNYGTSRDANRDAPTTQL